MSPRFSESLETADSSAQKSATETGPLYLITGATGFIGSEVFCRLTRKVPLKNILLLVRKKPKPVNSLFALRLKEHGIEESIPRVQFIETNFLKAETFQEDLKRLSDSHPRQRFRVLHLAAQISPKTGLVSKILGAGSDQERMNVGVTADLLAWGETHADSLVYASSMVAFGATETPIVRDEQSYASFPELCENFPYFSTKRRAHDFVVANSKIPTQLICPSIVHGSLENFKDSRTHLKMLRQGRLRWAPPGGGNFVGLDRVSRAFVEAALRDPAEVPGCQTRLLVDKNMSYLDYFQLYVNLYRGDSRVKVWPMPKLVGTAALSALSILEPRGLPSAGLGSLGQSSMYLYFESKFQQPATDGLEAALLKSTATL